VKLNLLCVLEIELFSEEESYKLMIDGRFLFLGRNDKSTSASMTSLQLTAFKFFKY